MARMTEKYHLVDLSNEVIDLGKDGSKWRHGYVPLNPAAVKLKMHGKPGKSGGGEHARPQHDSYLKAIGMASSERSEYDGLPGHGKDTYVNTRAGGSSHSTAMSRAKTAKPTSGISNPNAASMTNADKIKAAERMFGTGSPQHMAAKKKFGAKKR